MAGKKQTKAAEPKVDLGGVPEGHEVTLAEEKMVRTVEQAVMDSAEIFQMAGRIQMADFVATVAEKSIAEFYIKIKESKGYKGLPYRDADGKTATVATLDEFCEVFLKRSARRCRELESNYHLIGADLYETSEQLGLGQRDYNAIKALPEDHQQLVIQAIAQADSREAVVSLVEELANRNAVERKKLADEKSSLEQKVSDLKADAEAHEQIIGDKNRKLDEQAKLIAKLQNKAGDWGPRAKEVCIETTRHTANGLEALDQLDAMRDIILNEEFSEDERDKAIEAMAVVYYDGLSQLIDRASELMAACEEVFIGYKERARPLLQVFDGNGKFVEASGG